MVNSEIYDMMTNYQAPQEFLQFLDPKNDLDEYVQEYVEDMKEEMLPDSKLSLEEITIEMILYLKEAYQEFLISKTNFKVI